MPNIRLPLVLCSQSAFPALLDYPRGLLLLSLSVSPQCYHLFKDFEKHSKIAGYLPHTLAPSPSCLIFLPECIYHHPTDFVLYIFISLSVLLKIMEIPQGQDLERRHTQSIFVEQMNIRGRKLSFSFLSFFLGCTHCRWRFPG